jgi:hypothetical protein
LGGSLALHDVARFVLYDGAVLQVVYFMPKGLEHCEDQVIEFEGDILEVFDLFEQLPIYVFDLLE